jgi:hypothetical protein
MSASILKEIGHEEWAADDEAHYVQIVQRLASDREALFAEKRGLRERMKSSPALDIDRYVRDMELLYRQIWADWCATADEDEASDTPLDADAHTRTSGRKNRGRRDRHERMRSN